MKVLYAIAFSLTFFDTSGQVITEKYRDYFGHSLELSSDSTFKFELRFDLIYNWAEGKWSINDDNLTLNFVNIYDTLIREDKPDTLVLSIDPVSNAISFNQYGQSILILGGQDGDRFPTQLKKKGKRLFQIDENGKALKTRNKGMWPQKRLIIGYRRWPNYYRIVDK